MERSTILFFKAVITNAKIIVSIYCPTSRQNCKLYNSTHMAPFSMDAIKLFPAGLFISKERNHQL